MEKCLTGSLEDYLEVVYIIEQSGKEARLTDIANFLSFSKASVSRAISTLKAENIVLQEKYGKIVLTEKGRKIAANVYDRHKILTKFFTDILKVSPEIAETDACRAEHILSKETLLSIEKFLKPCLPSSSILQSSKPFSL